MNITSLVLLLGIKVGIIFGLGLVFMGFYYLLTQHATRGLKCLGQHSSGEEKENYLRTAIRDLSDCYYGSGVQIGAYARFYLGRHYLGKGMSKEAKALFEEIRRAYPDAVNHQGHLLTDSLPR